MFEPRASSRAIVLTSLLCAPLCGALALADDDEKVTTKHHVEVGEDNGDGANASVSTTIKKRKDDDDDDKKTVTKTTKKTIQGKDVDAEDLKDDGD